MTIKKLTGLASSVQISPKKYNAFLGVSLRNDYFSKNIIREYSKWASELFNEFVIVIVDIPEKYTLQVFKELDEKTAIQKAAILSEEKKLAFLRAIESNKLRNVKVMQFKDFVDTKSYQQILTIVKNYFKQNTKFYQTLQSMMDEAIGGKISEFLLEKNFSLQEQNALKIILFEYVIEEYAFMLYLTENGYPIEIDPYHEALPKKMLYEKAFPDLFAQLHITKRGHIFAYPRGFPYKKKLKKKTDQKHF